MAVRGTVSTDHGEFNYAVVQYWMEDRNSPYVRGASWDKLNTRGFDRATIYVSSPDKPTSGIYINIYGPYVDRDLLENELAAYIDDDDYGEAIG